MDTIIALVIVSVAAFFVGRSLYRVMSARKAKCDCPLSNDCEMGKAACTDLRMACESLQGTGENAEPSASSAKSQTLVSRR
jgi:hypothetical protein